MFEKGTSGNPSGRPRVPAAIKEILTDLAIELVEPNLRKLCTSADERIRLDATKYLADRVWGKPMQAVSLSGDGVDPMRLEVVYVSDWKTPDSSPEAPVTPATDPPR